MPVITNPVKAHRGGCDKSCCSGFERIQLLSSDMTFVDPQFAANVEPIILFDNTVVPALDDPNSIDRQAIMPALQLASVLVMATIPFFHTLMFSAAIMEVATTGRKSLRLLQESTWQTMTQADIDMTWGRLESFANKIVIGIDDHPGRSCTVALNDPAPVTGDIGEVGICINKELYDEIHDAYKSESIQGVDVARSVQLHARLASTLGHELSHCVSMLVHGNADIYFGDCPVAEEGFEWEMRAFGGLLEYVTTTYSETGQSHYPGSSGSKMLVLEEFPNRCLLQTYEDTNGRMGVQRPLPTTFISWNTDLKHLLRLFTREFWEVDYAAHGLAAVHHKITGARMLTRPDGWTVPLLSTSSIPDTLPPGYSVSRKGLIFPSTGFRAVQFLANCEFTQRDLDYCRLMNGVDQEGIPCFC